MKIIRAFPLLSLASLSAAFSLEDPNGKLRPSTNCWEDPKENLCNVEDITAMDVNGCVCSWVWDECPEIDCNACGAWAPKKLESCDVGCRDNDMKCHGCGLFFATICSCIQNPGKCPSSGEIKKKGQPVWIYVGWPENRKPEAKLVTTPKRMSGILEMVSKKNRDFGNQGWMYAQTKYDFSDEALALNSYRARTQEQVHIHVCPINRQTQKMLSKESLPLGDRLVQLEQDKDMFCTVRPKGAMATSFAKSLREFLDKKIYLESPDPKVCERFVGAGIIRDNRGNTWACATTNREGPLPKMCESKFVKGLYSDFDLAII